jgi:DNA polymerase-3 subunit delta
MKLRPAQLKQHLDKGKLSPLYVVSGEEPLLVMECCDLIRHAARTTGIHDREVHHGDAGFEWAGVLESANSLSLFGDRKLVEIRQDKIKLDDRSKKAMLEYLERPNPDTLLLLVWPKFEKGFDKSKWFTSFESLATIIQIWPLESKDFPAWLDARMRTAGLQAQPEAIQLLAERVQGNLLAASQEVEKLRLIAPSPQINAEMIRQSVADHARYDVFSLVDETLEGRTAAALKMLKFCKMSGEEPTIIVWAFSRELRQLHRIRGSIDKGINMQRALQEAGIWEKKKPVVQKAVSRLALRDIEDMLATLARVDKSIKGWGGLSPWAGLEQLILIGGRERHQHATLNVPPGT